MTPTSLPWIPALIACGLTLHAALNATRLPRPSGAASTVEQSVAVLVPARDEAHRIGPCVASILAQRGVPELRLLVLDDGSSDGTAAVVRAVAAGDHRLTVLTGQSPPPGWLGKPYACHQLAAAAGPGDVLVFVDADVVLEPDAIAAAVGLLPGRALLSPYPRIVARGWAERLIQPLLQWSWLTFLPLRAMERSRRPSLAAAGGQFLVVTRAGYESAGGHAAVRDQVLEDVALARAVKRSGGRIALADGSRLATCRMYDGARSLVEGYGKSLWAAFGPPLAGTALALLLLFVYVVPVLLVVAGFPLAGAVGYLLGVAGRVVTGRATGGRVWPDALAHPLSVLGFVVLLGYSYLRGRSLRWKGRPVSTVDS
jgi:glycosyl transferase family 2